MAGVEGAQDKIIELVSNSISNTISDTISDCFNTTSGYLDAEESAILKDPGVQKTSSFIESKFGPGKVMADVVASSVISDC